MESEQKALGEFASRFVICRNKPENDLYWDTQDPVWLGKVSMSRRHRFLTTKNLHWEWFNPLVFGLCTDEEGGADAETVLEEVECMKRAALHYATHVGGWSKDV